MIAVIATGIKHGDLGSKRENFIMDVSKVCIDELNINNFKAVVHIKQTRSRKLMDNWAVGYASMDKVDTKDGKWWWGVIEITNQHPKALAETLCHEFAHIKQYLRKELSMDGRMWKGKDISQVPYHKQPCEKEAYRLQEKLYKKVVDLKYL